MLATNVSYFLVLDPRTIAATNTVALDYGRIVIGKAGAIVFSTLVAISCVGTLNNSYYTSQSLVLSRNELTISRAARLRRLERQISPADVRQAGRSPRHPR